MLPLVLSTKPKSSVKTLAKLLQDPPAVLAAVCDAAAAKVGPPVRGAEPAWSCVEALKAAGSGDFAAGLAKEGALFSTVRGGVAAAVAVAAAGVCWRERAFV